MGSEMEESKEFVGEKNWKKTIFGRLKPYLLCVFCSFCYAAFNIISMVCLDKGMSRYVLVAYGYVFGTVATAFLALLLERKIENKISLPACIDILLLGLLGTSGRIVFYAGMEYTSPAFASAMNNLVPSITFILAIFFRMEKLNLLKLSGQAKIAGTIIAFGGATLMTLYKGITVVSLHASHTHAASKILIYRNLIKGSLLLLFSDLLAAAFYIVQATAVKKYPAPMTLTTLSGLSGTIMAIIAAAVPDHRASSWRLSLNITLIAPLYIGIVIFGITTYIQTIVVRTNGPVFVTAFRPLITVIVAIMGPFILGEALHLGGIIGATMIILGLYVTLWGKEEEKQSSSHQLETPVICDQEIEIRSQK
ncbi:WAT1-related protein At5g07050-like [Hevea brasiliensis]|uniref:WAT1-related protein At5g07050-like n=1 Tax=Hevea brasiliensis TaxID=3981 RepID=UPI0025D63216|nr:WAT1-related protein At5g07050-like [Hevea brasiliensis]